MRAEPRKCEPSDISQAAVLGIDAVERQPDRQDTRRRKAEVIVVLMRRSHVVRAGRLVEPFRLICGGRLAKQGFGQCDPAGMAPVVGEERIAIHPLQLFERLGLAAIFVKGIGIGQRGNDLANVAVEILLPGGQVIGGQEIANRDEAVPIEVAFRSLSS